MHGYDGIASSHNGLKASLRTQLIVENNQLLQMVASLFIDGMTDGRPPGAIAAIKKVATIWQYLHLNFPDSSVLVLFLNFFTAAIPPLVRSGRVPPL